MELARAGGSERDHNKAVIEEDESHCYGSRSERKKEIYAYLKEHFNVTKFILQSGQKLRLPPVAIASACVLYHRFWKQYFLLGSASNSKQDFDSYMLGTTSLYLASKAEEFPHKLRDVINVCHRTLHRESFLDVGTEYWKLRDSLVSCEFFMLRVLGFKVATDNPHKYLLHYLKSLHDWVEPDVWRVSNISEKAWSILSDCIHIPVMLDYKPSHIALAVIFFAVLCTGMEVPSQGARKLWWQALCDTITIDEIQQIIGDIMDLYDFESKPLLCL